MVSLLNCEKKFDDMFSHFDTVPACDRRTSYDSVVRAMHTYRAVISDEPVLSGVVNEGDVGGSSLCSQCVTRWRCSRAMKRVAPTGAVSANLAANHRCRTCSHVSRWRQTLRVASNTWHNNIMISSSHKDLQCAYTAAIAAAQKSRKRQWTLKASPKSKFWQAFWNRQNYESHACEWAVRSTRKDQRVRTHAHRT